jgi:putative ABC transport system ATP-binding protein
MMVTHSMSQALSVGTRTIMLHEGKIILDVRGEERAGLTVEDLVEQGVGDLFVHAAGIQ